MARYIREFQAISSADAVLSGVHQYLTSEGYAFIEYHGEKVYKKGSGWFVPPSFFKFSVSGQTIRLETWMKYVLLPGVFVGELGVTGFIGCAVKGSWKDRISQIERILGQNGSAVFPEQTPVFSQPAVSRPAAKTFCTACGAEVPAGNLFCTHCGHEVEEPLPADSGAESSFSVPVGGNAQVSKREWLKHNAPKSSLKEVWGAAIACYIFAGLTFVFSLITNPLGILDALIFAGLALGMHLTYNKVWAILLCVFSGVEVLLMLLLTGTLSGWLWIISSVFGVVACCRLDKQYQQFINGTGVFPAQNI